MDKNPRCEFTHIPWVFCEAIYDECRTTEQALLAMWWHDSSKFMCRGFFYVYVWIRVRSIFIAGLLKDKVSLTLKTVSSTLPCRGRIRLCMRYTLIQTDNSDIRHINFCTGSTFTSPSAIIVYGK